MSDIELRATAPDGRRERRLRRLGIGAAVVGLVAISALGVAVSLVLTAAGAAAVCAVLVAALGATMVLTATDRLRTRSRWLLLPALAVALPCGLMLSTGLSGVGHHDLRPTTPAALVHLEDEIALGAITLDLTGIRWTPGTTARVRLRAGMGAIFVTVPRGLCVRGVARAGVGGTGALGGRTGGVNPRLDIEAAVPEGRAVVELDLRTAMGAVTVERAGDDGDLWEEGRWTNMVMGCPR